MNRPVRVALAGAHGTGKTTLAKALVQRLESSGLVARCLLEAPREICTAAGDPIFFRRGNNTLLRQNLIFLVHLMQEFNSILGDADIVISDRSLLDHWAYTLYLFKEELEDQGVSGIYEAFIIDHCRKYDFIFFTPVEFSVLDDGTREGDKDFQADIQRSMLDLIEAYRIEMLIVKGSIQERTDYCAKVVEPLVEARKKGG
jgi:nicotinamide riboside kinase